MFTVTHFHRTFLPFSVIGDTVIIKSQQTFPCLHIMQATVEIHVVKKTVFYLSCLFVGAVPQDIDRIAISANFSNTNWMKNEMENIKKKLNQIDPTGKLEKQFLAYYPQELFVRNMLIDTFYICPMNFLTKEIRKILTSSLYYYIIPEIGDVIEELDHIQDHQFRSYIVLQYNERRDWLVFLYEFANTGYMTEWGVYPNRTFINTSLKPEPISQTNVTLGDKKCTFWKSFQALNDKLNSSKDN